MPLGPDPPDGSEPPLWDPFLHPPAERAPRGPWAATQRPEPTAREGAPNATPPRSTLALLAALLWPLPLGGLFSIALGAQALREVGASGGRLVGRGLAVAGIVLGVFATLGWAAVGGLALRARASGADAPVPVPNVRPRNAPPSAHVPEHTWSTQVGGITVVDLGVDVREDLQEQLRRQVVEASTQRQTVVLMTTAGDCEPCRGVDAALPDPRMQQALRGVRLVRADLETLLEPLAALGIPVDAYPGFFLLAVDGRPRDGIHGGEWDDDVPENIAPVLAAFVRGTYASRRAPWSPPSPGGTPM